MLTAPLAVAAPPTSGTASATGDIGILTLATANTGVTRPGRSNSPACLKEAHGIRIPALVVITVAIRPGRSSRLALTRAGYGIKTPAPAALRPSVFVKTKNWSELTPTTTTTATVTTTSIAPSPTTTTTNIVKAPAVDQGTEPRKSVAVTATTNTAAVAEVVAVAAAAAGTPAIAGVTTGGESAANTTTATTWRSGRNKSSHGHQFTRAEQRTISSMYWNRNTLRLY